MASVALRLVVGASLLLAGCVRAPAGSHARLDGSVDAAGDAGRDLALDSGVDSSDLIGPPPDMRPPLCAFESVLPLAGNGVDRVWVSLGGRVFVARGRAVFERESSAWKQVVGSVMEAGDGQMVGLRGNASHLYALHSSGVLWRILLATGIVDTSAIGDTVMPTSLAVEKGEVFVASASTVYAVQWQTPVSALVPLGSTAKDFPNGVLKALWHDDKYLWVAGTNGLLAYHDEVVGRWNKETGLTATWTAGWGQNPGLRIEVVVGLGGKGRRLIGTSAVVTGVDATRDALAIWGRTRFDVYAGGRAGLLKVLGVEGGWKPLPVSDGSVPSTDEVVDLWGNKDTLVAGITRDPSGSNQALILRCQLR